MFTITNVKLAENAISVNRPTADISTKNVEKQKPTPVQCASENSKGKIA